MGSRPRDSRPRVTCGRNPHMPRRMQPLRALIRMPVAALMLALLALCVRALVPAGYMPGSGEGRFSVVLCEGATGARTVTMAIPGAGKASDKAAQHSADMPCAFTALAQAALDGPDSPAPVIRLLSAPASPALLAALVAPALRIAVPPATGPPAFR